MFDIEFATTPFGSLKINNVYAYYDEPTIFCAKNEFGQLYFCYWIKDDQEAEYWIINPVSVELVTKLEQKKLPLSKLIKPSGYEHIFMFRFPFDEGSLKKIDVPTHKKLPFTLPDSSVYIADNINIDGSRKHTHRVRISKENSHEFLPDKLAALFQAFSNYYNALRKSQNVSSSLATIDATSGSFNFRVKASNLSDLQEKVYPTFRNASSLHGLQEIIATGQVDLVGMRKLFGLLKDNDTDIELIEESSTEIILKLRAEDVENLLPELDEKLTTYLDSTMVPQADHLDSIKHYIELIHQNGYVTADTFVKTPRQVSYYRDAVIILGLMHDYGKLTPIGLRALELERNDFVSLLQKQFEETECGFIWMNVSGVTSATDLDGNEAGDFLTEHCRGLSENTAQRRGATLKRWIEEFKEL